MPAFTSFNSRLPDPTFGVNDAGAIDAAGTKGPGFANVTVQSNRPVQVSKTISGRGVHRETGAHHWGINISYHPMMRDQFDTVSSFLEARNGRLNPFFVVLPQYSKPKDPTFAAYAAANTIIVYLGHNAGTSVLNIKTPTSFVGNLRAGDYFTITDGADVNHTKAYKVVRVETYLNYQTGSPALGSTDMRLHIVPPLVKNTAHSSTINFINPQFRVMQVGDVLETQLNTDNLYQFQLSLEEIQP